MAFGIGDDVFNPTQAAAAGMDPFELKRDFGRGHGQESPRPEQIVDNPDRGAMMPVPRDTVSHEGISVTDAEIFQTSQHFRMLDALCRYCLHCFFLLSRSSL